MTYGVPPEQQIIGGIVDTIQGHEAIRHRAKAHLEHTIQEIHKGVIAPEIASLPLSITSSVIEGEDIASALVDTVEKKEEIGGSEYDLIAMATHGHGGLQRWVMGSVTDRALHATTLPLLIVRPDRPFHDAQIV